MKLAKVRHRVMASLLDFAIIAGLLGVIILGKLPVIISIFSQKGGATVTAKFILDLFRYGIIYCIILLAYYVAFPLLFNGQTFGKKVFKLQIVKENGSKVDGKTMFYREGVGRIFINFASLGVTSIVSVIIMILREDKKDLADILAKTKVIDLYESEEN